MSKKIMLDLLLNGLIFNVTEQQVFTLFTFLIVCAASLSDSELLTTVNMNVQESQQVIKKAELNSMVCTL